MNYKILIKVLKYTKKYRAYLVLSLVFAAISVALTLYFPILTGKAIDLIIDAGNVDFKAMSEVYKRAVVVIAVTAISQWGMNICNNKMTYGMVQDIRKEAFAKIKTLPLKYIDGRQTGDIVSKIVADVEQLSEGLLMGFTQLFTGVLTIFGTLAFMLTVNIKITLVVVLITPVSLFVANFIAGRTYKMFKLQAETRGEQTGLIDEMIGNQKVVQAYCHEEEALEKFDEINERLKKCSLDAVFFSSLVNPSTRFVNSLVYTGVGLIGAFSVITGSISVGQLACMLSYANQYTKPFNEVSGVVTELQNALACAAGIFEFIEEEPEVPENENAIIIENVRGEVSLKKVYFSYTPEQKLIQDFSLNVKPGQRVAIVGPTGCGKTTLINLLMRFYEINEGSIRVDGLDIRDIKRENLRKSYGMVLQETWLKNGTIFENIAYGNPDATKQEVVEAARAAHADSFIKRLENGYDTIIGEDGGSLSQGQKQLLCIARIMLCLPPMLILDEATSSIDTRTELKIQSAFVKMMKGRTSFIVAHRLSTIQSADIILVMKDGNVIEQGTHESLLKENGFYKRLYESQFS